MKAPDMKSASMELEGDGAEDFLQMIVHDEPMTPQDKSVADAWLRQQTNKLLAAFDSYQAEGDIVTVSYDYIPA